MYNETAKDMIPKHKEFALNVINEMKNFDLEEQNEIVWTIIAEVRNIRNDQILSLQESEKSIINALDKFPKM